MQNIIALGTDPDVHIQDLSTQVVDYLGDVTPAEVLAKAKMDIGPERMVSARFQRGSDSSRCGCGRHRRGSLAQARASALRPRVGCSEALLAVIHNPSEGSHFVASCIVVNA